MAAAEEGLSWDDPRLKWCPQSIQPLTYRVPDAPFSRVLMAMFTDEVASSLVPIVQVSESMAG